MPNLSTLARALLLLVATAAVIGLAGLYWLEPNAQRAPLDDERTASPPPAESTPAPAPDAAPVATLAAPPPPAPPPAPASPAPVPVPVAPEPTGPERAEAGPASVGTVTAPVPPAVPAVPPSPGLIDLNTASVADLNRLKGGNPIGRSIVKGRPYQSTDDLVRKRIVSRARYLKIKDRVVVR